MHNDQADYFCSVELPNDSPDYVPGRAIQRAMCDARRQQDSDDDVLAKSGDALDDVLFVERPFDRCVRLARAMFGERADEAIAMIRKMRVLALKGEKQ